MTPEEPGEKHWRNKPLAPASGESGKMVSTHGTNTHDRDKIAGVDDTRSGPPRVPL